jgi:hypothetical protein
MSSPLEKFILENREKFDGDAPDPKLWEKISGKLNAPENEKAKPLRSLPFKRWMAVAATLVLIAATGIIYYSMHRNVPETNIVTTQPAIPGNNLPVPGKKPDSVGQVAKTDVVIPRKINPGEQVATAPENGQDKEMYYYTKLIELKHEELKTLEKDEPLLYRQFAGDVQKLDSVYHTLKIQLPNNSNREQVIEAMISNLQLQIGLLNKQLNIIKQIKHSKKSAYEKAYKSV